METINDYMPLSPDWNRERLEQLKALFPDLFTNEGKLNIDELKKVIDPQSVTETERYEFRWFGKSAAKRNAFTPSNATLQFDEKRSVNPNESENIIIEGENLEVLKLLSNGYREKIKCIYIDPPYNTGGDFVYSDNYNEDKKPYWEQTGVTENGIKIDTNNDTNGRFHSNWLDMMFSRLLIARQLLTEDGIIFISIDDNEVHNLKKLCDEVFGEENFLGQISRGTGTPTGQGTKGLVSEIDYILVYSKSDRGDFNGIEFDDDDKIIYNQTDDIGEYLTRPLRKTGGEDKREHRPSMYFAVTAPNDEEIYPIGPGGYESRWRCSLTKYEQLESKKMIEWKQIKEDIGLTWRPYLKFYLEGRLKQPSNLWDDLEGNKKASVDLKKLLGEKVFDFPKPIELIKKCIQIASDDEDIILDFFAGSGSTGQSVFDLNKNSGNRKFILVQIPESTDEKSEAYKADFTKISAITIERNKRVIEKIIEEKKSKTPNIFVNGHKEGAVNGLGFKVFKLVKSNFPRVEFAPDLEKTEDENIELLKKYIAEKEEQLNTAFNRDELLTEILIKNGFNLNYKIEKQAQFVKNDIYLATDAENEMLICLDYILDPETVTYFKTHTDTKFICLERALDTTKKYSLKHYMGKMFKAF